MICSRSPSWEGIPPGSNSHVLPSAARLSLVQPQILVQAPNPPGSPRKLQSLGDTGRAPACLLHPVGPARGSESSRGPMDSLVFTQDGVVPGGQCFLTPDTHTHTQELGLCPSEPCRWDPTHSSLSLAKASSCPRHPHGDWPWQPVSLISPRCPPLPCSPHPPVYWK